MAVARRNACGSQSASNCTSSQTAQPTSAFTSARLSRTGLLVSLTGRIWVSNERLVLPSFLAAGGGFDFQADAFEGVGAGADEDLPDLAVFADDDRLRDGVNVKLLGDFAFAIK